MEISNFERRGVFSLLFILASTCSYYFWRNARQQDVSSMGRFELEQLQLQLDSAFKNAEDQNRKDSEKSEFFTTDQKPILDFNPNNANLETLLACGVPKKIANNILKYRSKGGLFRNKNALKKIYGMNEELFIRISPHILLEEYIDKKVVVKQDTSLIDRLKEVVRPLEINHASQSDLEKLVGIGPSYAKWIIEYRERLGGFSSLQQLLEVYRIEQSTIDLIAPYVTVNPAYIQRISINTDSVSHLKNHPYLSHSQARAIYNYRLQHGPFTDIAELGRLYVFKKKDLSRIFPYLDVK